MRRHRKKKLISRNYGSSKFKISIIYFFTYFFFLLQIDSKVTNDEYPNIWKKRSKYINGFILRNILWEDHLIDACYAYDLAYFSHICYTYSFLSKFCCGHWSFCCGHWSCPFFGPKDYSSTKPKLISSFVFFLYKPIQSSLC